MREYLEGSQSSLGSPFYKPPFKDNKDKKEKFKGNLWSIGVMLYKIYFKELPFNNNIISYCEFFKYKIEQSLKDLISN